MTTRVNGAVWGSMNHRFGSVGRTQQAADYIGDGGAGGLSEYDQTLPYGEGDVIVRDDKLYSANDNIPTNTPFVEGSTGATWTEVSSATGDIVVRDWNNSTDYAEDSVTVKDGVLKRATSSVTNGGAPGDWELVPAGIAHMLELKTWAMGTVYPSGALIFHSGSIFRANLTRPASVVSFDATEQANWTEVSGSGGGLLLYVQTDAYDLNDVVIKDNMIYMANANIPANTPFAEGNTGTTWRELSRSRMRGTFSATSAYFANDVVAYNDSLWIATAKTAPGAFIQANWSEIFTGFRYRAWQPATAYQEGQVVEADGVAHVRVSNGSSGATWNATEQANWKPMVAHSAIKGEYTTGQSYAKGEMVTYNGKLYSSNDELGSAPATFDDTAWTLVASRGRMQGNYSTTGTYFIGDIVIFENAFYQANVAMDYSGGATNFTNANWSHLLNGTTFYSRHSTTVQYYRNDVVSMDGRLLRAVSDNTGTYVPADWTPHDTDSAPFVWNTGLEYVYNRELVMYEGRIYKANGDIVEADLTGNNPSTIAAFELWQHAAIKGEHDQTLAYLKDDLVIKNARLFRANSDITAGTAFDIGTGALKWSEISAVSDMLAPDWQANTEYVESALIVYGNLLYRNSSGGTITSEATWDTTEQAKWTELKATAAAIARTYTDNEEYVVNEITFHEGDLYRANTAIATTPDPFNPSQWDRLTEGSTIVKNYQPNSDYVQHEMITHEGLLYRAVAAITSANATFQDAEWSLVQDTSIFKVWAAATEYIANEVVLQDDTLYRANNDITSEATWDATEQAKWTPIYAKAKLIVREFVINEDWAENELAINNDIVYRSTEAQTSAATFDVTKWAELGPRDKFRGKHSATEDYKADDIIVHDNMLFETTSDLAASAFDYSDWTPVMTETVFVAWAAGSYYSLGEVVQHNGTMLRRTTAGVSEATFDATEQGNWELFKTPTVIRSYTTGETYFEDELISENDKLWTANENIISAPAIFDTTKWTVLLGGEGGISEYSTTAYYISGQSVTYQGNIWTYGGTNGVQGAFNIANWSRVSADAAIVDWEADWYYAKGQFALLDGFLYARIVDGVAESTLDSTERAKWRINIAPGVSREYTNGEIYFANELVIHNGLLLLCLNDHTAAVDEPGDDNFTYVDRNRGTWAIDTSYFVGHVVRHEDLYYVANTTHVSNGVAFSADVANWDRVGAVANINDWEADTYYEANDIVLLNDVFLKRKANGTSEAAYDATEAAAWEYMMSSPFIREITTGDVYRQSELVLLEGNKVLRALVDNPTVNAGNEPDVDDWFIVAERNNLNIGYDQRRHYAQDSVILHNDTWYRATNDVVPNNVGFQSAEWTIIKSRSFIGEWEAATEYGEDQVVSIDGRLIRCSESGGHTSGATFDVTEEGKWSTIVESGKLKGPYTQDVTYLPGDIAYAGNSLYLCNTRHVGAATFNAAARADWNLLLVGSAYYMAADVAITFPSYTSKGTAYVIEEDYTAAYLGVMLQAGTKLELKEDKEAGDALTDINDFWVFLPENLVDAPSITTTITARVGFGTPAVPGIKFPANAAIDLNDALLTWDIAPPADLTQETVVGFSIEGRDSLGSFSVTGPQEITLTEDLYGDETIAITYG